MNLAFIAHSERCALLLDDGGVCRWVVPKVDASDDVVMAAKRCIGAQYVASLDPDAAGLIGHGPRVGTNLLFALVTDGRVALVRFGPILAFEKLDEPSVAPVASAIESTVSAAPPPSMPVADAGRDEVLRDDDDVVRGRIHPIARVLSVDSIFDDEPDPDSRTSVEIITESLARIAAIAAIATPRSSSDEPCAVAETHALEVRGEPADDGRFVDAPRRFQDRDTDTELDIITGLFARDPVEQSNAPARPSGLVIRRTIDANGDLRLRMVPERLVEADVETHRFFRTAGASFLEEPLRAGADP